MRFSLIICTYERPDSLIRLLNSLQEQSTYPDEVIIVDGSHNDLTRERIWRENILNINYYKVGEKDRGLTKQRNYGISTVSCEIDIICFLDDDVVLTPYYFQQLLDTYAECTEAIGVGGYIINETVWQEKFEDVKHNQFFIDGWIRDLGSRNALRKKMGLLSKEPPGYMPEFSNGFSTGFLPPSGKTYQVEYFMGGVASYRKDIFKKIKFSPYFEGYGLYEDMDFCLRASRLGTLYVNTAAQLYHYHEASGRPNRFTYGKMVLRNGWYVWRVKYPQPSWMGRIKWNTIALTLTVVRLMNIFTTNKRKEALTESLGRIVGWWSLLLNKPKIHSQSEK